MEQIGSLIDFHLKNYTLQENDLTLFFFFSLQILTVIGTIAKFSISNTKTLAWVVSLINSVSMSVIGVIFTFFVYSSYPAFFLMGEDGLKIWMYKSNLTILTCIWFAAVNIFDLVFGLIFYRKYLSVTTTYIHHSVFTWACFAFASGDAILFKVRPTPGAFALAMVEEIPTAFLAIGSTFPALRTDIGFGLSFFLFRIVFHFYILVNSLYLQVGYFQSVITSMSMILHLMWFSSWFTKYLARSQDKGVTTNDTRVKKNS